MHNKTLNALQFYNLTVRQHENAAITYTIKWSPAFATGVTLSTSTWSSEDSGVTIANAASTTTAATARISASPGRYRVVNKITTSAGDTDERYLDVIVHDNNRRTSDYGRYN